MPLKTNDMIFFAMDSPDFACLPSDPLRPGVRLDYSQPIQSPWMRGVGQPLASANPSSRPTSMVELAKLWREERNLMSNEAYDAMLETAARQRAAVEAAAALAPLVSDDELKTILEEIEACQQQ